jgi:LacI family transcriptional regulator
MGKKPKPRVTLYQVAARAGVGSATVDRVLNERGNVSDALRKRVIKVARELGLRRILPSPHHKLIRINVILPRPDLPLIRRMGFEFRKLSQRIGHDLSIHRTVLDNEEASTIAASLKTGHHDAAIVYAQDRPLIKDTIAALAEEGRPVITMISDLPGSLRLAYVGIDHYKAGRTAGYFLGRMSPPGKVVVLCHHLRFQAHSDRIAGLKDQLVAQAPRLNLTEIVEGGDDPARSETRLKAAFRRHPETVAVYNVGAGNRGVAAAIRADVLPARPIFIGHELTAFTHSCLKEQLMTLTIDQNPERQAQMALEVLMHHFGFEGVTSVAPPYASTVPFIIYGPQNLPEIPPAH